MRRSEWRANGRGRVYPTPISEPRFRANRKEYAIIRSRSETRLSALPLISCCLLFSCALPASRTPGTESLASARERSGGEGIPTIEVTVSPVTNLFHWVDHLAGTSYGKTTSVYRRHWIERNGRLDESDRRALLAFRRARVEGTRSHAIGLPEPSLGRCMPEPYEKPNARARLSIAAMESKSIDELVSKSRAFLSAETVVDLEYALRHFEPAWTRIWQESEFLHAFREKTERFVQSPEVQDLVGRIVAYLGADVPATSSAHISLVALLEYGPTHAEANGDHLLLEIRPDDDPQDQVQVIFHELAHFLMRRLPDERRQTLARAFLAKGPRGALTWNMLREALPTALGQGVAQARLAPEGFSLRQRWYHLPAIDDVAHRIYPFLLESIRSGASLDVSDIESFVRAVDEQIYSAAPLLHFLPDAVLLSSSGDTPWLQRWRAAQGGMNQRVASTESLPGGLASLLQSFECLPFVLFTGHEKDGTYDLPPDLVDQTANTLLETQGGGSYAVPLRRRSGAPSLLVLLDPNATIGEVQRNLARVRGWPKHPIKVGAP